jgi:hypothetical protein
MSVELPAVNEMMTLTCRFGHPCACADVAVKVNAASAAAQSAPDILFFMNLSFPLTEVM